MLIALPEWNGRISPVFDESHNFRIMKLEEDRIESEDVQKIPWSAPERRIYELKESGVELVICGAISRYSERILEMHGIEVMSFIAGETQSVIQAYISGEIGQQRFIMPGCGRRNLMERGRGCRHQGRGRRMREQNHRR